MFFMLVVEEIDIYDWWGLMIGCIVHLLSLFLELFEPLFVSC